MIRRRDRIQPRHHDLQPHDDRGSIVTSATEEPTTSIKTLHARQVEVVEVDHHRVVDRVIEFVSSSILVRAWSRAGTAGSVLTCVVGGGALSLYRFQDSDFFAVSDSNVLMLLCAPKIASPDEFQTLLEQTLGLRCCLTPKLMSVVNLDAAAMNRVWQAAESIAVRRRAATVEVGTRAAIETIDYVVDPGSTRVSAAHSHLTSAVDELVRSLFEHRGIHATTSAVNNVKVTLASHATSGRLAGAVSLVHVVEALIGCFVSCSASSVALVRPEICHCVLTAAAALAWDNMLMVADATKTPCIASSIVHVSVNEEHHADISLAISAAASLLSCAPEDLLIKTIQQLHPVTVASDVLRLVRLAEFATRLMEDLLCQGPVSSELVARQILAITGDELPNDEARVLSCARGTAESVWTGAAVILSTAAKAVDQFVVEETRDERELHALVTAISTLMRRMCFVLSALEIQSSTHALPLLQRWLTAFTSSFRRASMWCAMVPCARDDSQLARDLFESAITFLMTKSLVAPFDGTSRAKLGLISHQWLVHLSISAGPAAHDVVIHVLDRFYRSILKQQDQRRTALWNEVATALEGLVASIPSPSPMLKMWHSVASVANAFQQYSEDHQNVDAQQVIVSHVARVASLNQDGLIDDLPGAELHFKEKPWMGRWEKFDVITPLDVMLPAFGKPSASTEPRLHLSRFGVSPQDLHVIAPSFTYVWESLKTDLLGGRHRSLATQCLSLSDLLRCSGAPLALCVVLAACGVAKLAILESRLQEENSSALQLLRTYTSIAHTWLDLQLALHLASVPERSTPTAFAAERNQTDGLVGRHLPQAVRLGVQNKAQGKLSIVDRIALAYSS